MKQKLSVVLLIGLGVIIIVLVVYFISLGKMSFLAAPGDVTISLSPNSGSYNVGDTIPVNIIFNAGGKSITGIDIVHLHYDPNLLEVEDANTSQIGIQVQPGSIFKNFVINAVDTKVGQITLMCQIEGGGSGFTGEGIIATINFKVKTEGSATVSFDYLADSGVDTNAWETGNGTDVLSTASNANFVLGETDQTLNETSNTTSNPSDTDGQSESINNKNQVTPTLTEEQKAQETAIQETKIKAEAERIRQENLNKTRKNNYILIGLSVALILGIIGFILYRRKKLRQSSEIKGM